MELEDQEHLHGDGIKNLFSRAMDFADRHPENKIVEKMKITLMRGQTMDSHTNASVATNGSEYSNDEVSVRNYKPISHVARRLAAESFKFMNEADSGGDIIIIESCYVMIGTKPQEQSLVLSALQKVVDVEREVRILLVFKIILHFNRLISSPECFFLLW